MTKDSLLIQISAALTLFVIYIGYNVGLRGQLAESPEADTSAIPPELLKLFQRPCNLDGYRGAGPDFERSLIALSGRLVRPNPELVSKILTASVRRSEFIDDAQLWFKKLLFYLPPNEYQNFLLSAIELFCQTWQPDLETQNSQSRLLCHRLYIYCIPGPPSVENREDSTSSAATYILDYYLDELRKSNKGPNEVFVDLLFRSKPELALQVMFQDSGGRTDPVRIRARQPYRLQMDHVVHFVRAASARIQMHRAQKRDVDLAQDQVRWLLRTYPHWWAKRYVLEILLRNPELSDEEFLQALRTEKHPSVVKRLPELEKKLRQHTDTLPSRH